MLAYLVAAIGVAIALMGVVVLAAPAAMRQVARSLRRPRLLYAAVASRIVAGAFMVFASQVCAWPLAIGTVGVVMLVAGFAGLFIGVMRLNALMEWFFHFSDAILRVWSLIAIALGGFIVFAAL